MKTGNSSYDSIVLERFQLREMMQGINSSEHPRRFHTSIRHTGTSYGQNHYGIKGARMEYKNVWNKYKNRQTKNFTQSQNTNTHEKDVTRC